MSKKTYKANILKQLLMTIINSIVSIILCKIIIAVISFLDGCLMASFGPGYALPLKRYSAYIMAIVVFYNIYYVFVKKRIEVELEKDVVNVINCGVLNEYNARNDSFIVERVVTQTLYLIPIVVKNRLKVLTSDGKVAKYDLYAFSKKDLHDLKNELEGKAK